MYESQVIDYTPQIKYIPGDLYTLMSSGVSTQEEWDAQLKTRDPNIPRKHFDKAASVAYSAIKDTIDPIEGKDKRGYYPSNTNTTIEQKPLFNNSETIPTKNWRTSRSTTAQCINDGGCSYIHKILQTLDFFFLKFFRFPQLQGLD